MATNSTEHKRGFYVLENYLHFEDNIEDIQVCKYFRPIQVIQDDDGNAQIKIEFHDIFNNVCEKILPTTDFSKSKIEQTLTKIGISPNTKVSNGLLVSYVNAEKEKLERSGAVIKTSSRYGFNETYTAYTLDKIYSATGAEPIYSNKSTFNPCGSSYTYLEMLKKEILPNVKLLMPLMASFAAPLFTLLCSDQGNRGYIVNLSGKAVNAHSNTGKSSSGKSTAGMAATSVWGDPHIGEGLNENFYATANAVIDKFSKFNGLLCGFDDSTNGEKGEMKPLQLQAIIYELGSGKVKARLNKNSEQKDALVFSNIYLMSSENTILTNKARTGGFARCLEVSESAYTISAQNSQNITDCVTQNHGLLGKEFIQYLFKNEYNKKENLVPLYNKVHETLVPLTSNLCSELQRNVKSIAVIILAAALFENCFHIKVDKKELQLYLIDCIQKMALRLMPCEHLSLIARPFCVQGSNIYLNGVAVGVIKPKTQYGQSRMYWYVEKGSFDKAMQCYDVELMDVLKKLKELDYLDYEKGRNTRSQLIPSVCNTVCEYVVILADLFNGGSSL